MRRHPALEPRTRNELLDRNDRLVKEIVRLKAEVLALKRKFSALLIWKLSHTFLEKQDVATQTENIINNNEKGSSTPQLSHLTFDTSKGNRQRRSIETPLTPLSRSENSVAVSPSSQERVKETLTLRIRQEVLKFSTPEVAKRIDVSEISTIGPLMRTPRSVRKPVSYAEPSLATKMRKGFQFFKFQAGPTPVPAPALQTPISMDASSEALTEQTWRSAAKALDAAVQKERG
jgi:hypothetical protein